MRGQKTERGALHQLFGNGPANRCALLRGRSPAKLVHDDQGSLPNAAQDVRDFPHLQREGRRVALDAVAGADSGEDSVRDSERSKVRRDVTADLGHNLKQYDLLEVGAFAGHIGTGQDVEIGLHGHGRVIGNYIDGAHLLQDRMSALTNDQGIREGWTDKSRTLRDFGQGEDDVEIGDILAKLVKTANDLPDTVQEFLDDAVAHDRDFSEGFLASVVRLDQFLSRE